MAGRSLAAVLEALPLAAATLKLRAQRAAEASDPEIALAEQSLNAFIRQAWHVVEPATPFVDGWHLQVICEHLEAVTRGEIRNLVINIPPRHMKSLAVSVFWPCWEWLTHPARRWLFASYALRLSVRDSLKCRRIIESPWYQGRWGHVFQLTSDQNAKIKFENDQTGYRLSTSVSSAATGEGGDRIVCDDPHNVKDALSKAIRESTVDWWDQAMSTRANDPKTAAKVIVMQRVHEEDLSGHVLEQGGWEHLCLRAEYEPTKYIEGTDVVDPKSMVYENALGPYDLREQEGELLWGERFGPPELAELKRSLGPYGTAGQLQQRPSPAEGGLVKRDWWRFYQQVPARFDFLIQSWDMSFKDGDESSFVVGSTWGRLGADTYLLDLVRDHMDFPTTLVCVRTFNGKWHVAAHKLIEDKANGPAIIATLKHEITGLIAIPVSDSKLARAHACSAEIAAGNVYLPEPAGAPWVHDFIEEWALFPNGLHDDQVDITTQALLWLAENADSGWRLL